MPPGTSGATSCLIGCFMYLFGGYTMSGNVSTVYRIDLTPLCAGESAAGGRTLSIERLDPSNPDEAPIPSDKNVSWTHDGKFYVFGGYGYEPEWSHRHRGVMPRDCLFLPDPGSLWVSRALLGQLTDRSRRAQVPLVVGGTTSWHASIHTRVAGPILRPKVLGPRLEQLTQQRR